MASKLGAWRSWILKLFSFFNLSAKFYSALLIFNQCSVWGKSYLRSYFPSFSLVQEESSSTRIVFIYIFINSSASEGSSLSKDTQNLPLPNYPLQLIWRNTAAFPGQLRDVISQACPGCVLGHHSGGKFRKHFSQEVPRSHPSQIPEPPTSL